MMITTHPTHTHVSTLYSTDMLSTCMAIMLSVTPSVLNMLNHTSHTTGMFMLAYPKSADM